MPWLILPHSPVFQHLLSEVGKQGNKRGRKKGRRRGWKVEREGRKGRKRGRKEERNSQIQTKFMNTDTFLIILSNIWLANTFSQTADCLSFYLLFLWLCRIFYWFDVIPLFTFAFVGCDFGVISKTSLPILTSRSIFLFSSKSFWSYI